MPSGCRDLCADIEALTASGQHTVDDLDLVTRRLAKLARQRDGVRAQDPFSASGAGPAAAALAGCRDVLDEFAEHVHQAAEVRRAARKRN